MINIHLICLGTLKEKYLRDACAEYEKRLRTFCSLTLTEIQPKRLPDSPSDAQIAAALDAEAQLISKKIPAGARVYALCIEGELMSSQQLCSDIESAAVSGSGTLAFIIGSSYGLAPQLKKSAQVRLSMSPMTFPHQLARVMVLEQLYRVFQISSGGKYHK